MNEQDLHDVKGVVHYLNNAMRQDGGRTLEAEVILHDKGDGEVLGHVVYNGVDQYVFSPGRSD